MSRDGLTRLYEVAEPQAGYFTTAQAKAAGVERQYLKYHVSRGRLLRAAHGIYRLAQFPAQPFEDLLVVTLWAGPAAAISHDSALAVYGLGDAMPAVIHLTAPPQFRGRRRGVLLHPGELSEAERTVRDRVVITSPERTLADVARTQPAAQVAELVREVLARGLTTPRAMKAYAAAHPDVSPLLLAHDRTPP